METYKYYIIGLLLAIAALFALVCFLMNVNKNKQTNIELCNCSQCALKRDCFYHISNHREDITLVHKKDMMKRKHTEHAEYYCLNFYPKPS